MFICIGPLFVNIYEFNIRDIEDVQNKAKSKW